MKRVKMSWKESEYVGNDNDTVELEVTITSIHLKYVTNGYRYDWQGRREIIDENKEIWRLTRHDGNGHSTLHGDGKIMTGDYDDDGHCGTWTIHNI